MRIKNIEFNVNAASGALGWFGEGYWNHKWYESFFPSFAQTVGDMSFVAKTITTDLRIGNLPLDENYAPKDLFPRCIKVYPVRGFMLNAVDSSGPGFKELLATGKWQNIIRPALGISFMPVGNTLEEMLRETSWFKYELVKVIEIKRDGFASPIWIQINISCPNTGSEHQQLISDNVTEILKQFQYLRLFYDLVIDLKVNLLMPNEVIKEIWQKDLCDIVTISNTIKYGTEGLGIKWRRLFWWRKTSPLAEYGGGGLSGRPLFKPLCEKIMSVRRDCIRIPIKAGGGIFSISDIRTIRAYGANAIELGTVISLRPWRIRRLVEEAKKLFSN
ncbi:MAG: hypothetical protein Q8N57_00185 [bacterium]|nr:hypothetical protein [bacterium]